MERCKHYQECERRMGRDPEMGYHMTGLKYHMSDCSFCRRYENRYEPATVFIIEREETPQFKEIDQLRARLAVLDNRVGALTAAKARRNDRHSGF